MASFGADAPTEPHRGIRSKLCVADWNGDGRLDLLVGDFATQKPELPAATPEQLAERDRLRKELTAVQNQYSGLISKLYGDKKLEKEERDKLQKELTELGPRMAELRSKLPPEYENHGWVWLFLRETVRTSNE
jgi:predicted nuclease with TOPRIM domain